MARIVNWILLPNYDGTKFCIKGRVYDHPKQYKCPDGMMVHTSSIQSIEAHEDSLIVKTRNSEYILSKSEVGTLLAWDDIPYRKCLQKFFESEIADSLLQELSETQYRLVSDMMSRADKLETGQLYLELSSKSTYYCVTAWYKDDAGELQKCEIHTHMGLMQDSVLIVGDKCRASYYPYTNGNLEFYRSMYANVPIDPDAVLGYIYNAGDDPLRIQFSWGKAIEVAPLAELKICPHEIAMLPEITLSSKQDLYGGLQ